MKTDLGVVKVGHDNKADVHVPTKNEDIDQEYERALRILHTELHKGEKQTPDAWTKQEDYYNGFRSRVVLVWLLTNLALILGILRTDTLLSGLRTDSSESPANIYLTVSMNV